MIKKRCENCMNYVTKEGQYYCRMECFGFNGKPSEEEMAKVGLQAPGCESWEDCDGETNEDE